MSWFTRVRVKRPSDGQATEWRLRSLLGVGGFARVYEAEDQDGCAPIEFASEQAAPMPRPLAAAPMPRPARRCALPSSGGRALPHCAGACLPDCSSAAGWRRPQVAKLLRPLLEGLQGSSSGRA